MQLRTDERSDPAVAADDVMITHPHDFFVQSSPPEVPLHFTFYYKLSHGCKSVCSCSYAEEYDNNIEEHSTAGERMDLLVSNGGNGDEGHEEGVEIIPPFNEMESEGSRNKDYSEDQRPVLQLFCRGGFFYFQ
jgi:hypothetical protein